MVLSIDGRFLTVEDIVQVSRKDERSNFRKKLLKE